MTQPPPLPLQLFLDVPAASSEIQGRTVGAAAMDTESGPSRLESSNTTHRVPLDALTPAAAGRRRVITTDRTCSRRKLVPGVLSAAAAGSYAANRSNSRRIPAGPGSRTRGWSSSTHSTSQ
jgi:hypothetical protein